MARKIRVRPGVGALAVYKKLPLKHWVALGELVDNSFQSFLDNEANLLKLHGPGYKCEINVNIFANPVPTVSVTDNAGGIQEDRWEQALTPGEKRTDLGGLGQHGVGMKAAMYWYADNIVLETHPLGETVIKVVTIDLGTILESGLEDIDYDDEQTKSADDHGTKITMTNLSHGLPSGNQLESIKGYLGSIYREGIRSGKLNLRVNGDLLTYSEPALLKEPYWPSDKGQEIIERDGKQAVSDPIYWKFPLTFELSKSWEIDTRQNKPSKPQRIRGWIGILASPTTKLSGLALLWRGKVVVGAGSAAKGDTDTYRPIAVFGTLNLFPAQRLVGEIDVSELEVNQNKDGIVWQAQQEEEFQQELRKFLESEKSNFMLKMVRNWRSTLKSDEIGESVQSSVEHTANMSGEALLDALRAQLDAAELDDSSRVLFEPIDRESLAEGKSFIFKDSVSGRSYFLEVVTDSTSREIVRTIQVGDDFVISVNRRHPFMDSFANLPSADLDPVFRILVGAALVQIKLQATGFEGWYLPLEYLNKYLSEWLFRRMSR